MLLTGLLCGTASAHPQFMKALKAKYEFGTVSCYTCHMKGKDPATDKPYGKEVRNDFGQLFLPGLKGKDIDKRAEESAELKKDSDFDAPNPEAEKIDAGLTADFLEVLGKVEAMKNADGKTYGELLKKGEIEGTKFPDE
jgi:hypothetical protein